MKKSRALALVAVSTGALALSSTAVAGDLWWSALSMSPGTGASVATANADGTGVNQSIFSLPSGAMSLGAVTLDYAYFQKGTYIARVKLDGTGAENTFINAQIPNSSTTKMVIDGTTLYWFSSTQTEQSTGVYRIGKANLDGTGVDASYISGQQSTPARCGPPYFAVTSGYAFVRFPVGTPGGQPGSCTLGQPSSGGVDRISLSTKAVNANYYAGTFGDQGLTANATNVFGLQNDGQQFPSGVLYRANPTGALDGSAWVSGTGGALYGANGKLAANASKVFVIDGSGMNPPLKAVSATSSGGAISTLATLTGMGGMMGDLTVQAPVNSGSASGSGSGSAPAPAPAAVTAATVLKAPTQTSTPDAQGNVAVTLSLQLDEVGKYTFIFEKVTSTEMSREQATGSNRISMQKGTRIGKRTLKKVVTAANITTTSAGAKLVMKALLKKAQAKKWNLRVIHSATDGSQTQSVISK